MPPASQFRLKIHTEFPHYRRMEAMLLPALLNKSLFLSHLSLLHCADFAAPKASVFSCNSLLRDIPFLKWRNGPSYKMFSMHHSLYGLNCFFLLFTYRIPWVSPKQSTGDYISYFCGTLWLNEGIKYSVSKTASPCHFL